MKRKFTVLASNQPSTKKHFTIKASTQVWDMLKTKQVPDYDGFLTDYTLYQLSGEEYYVCILGDRDVYNPENTDPDFEAESYDYAVEWFDLYEGFSDDDEIEGSDCVNIDGATAEELQAKMNQYTQKQSKVSNQLDSLKNRAINGFGKNKVMSADVGDYEDEIQEINQEFTSENTSINSSKLPAIFNLVKFEPGTINLDYGGGKFDNVADYLTQYDVINLVYDPYNRSAEHNREVVTTIKDAGGADTATCSNVLNVIKEPEVRQNVLNNMRKLVKSGGKIYITVYEGKGDGAEGPTKSGYQLNRKTADYLEEIQQIFPDAKRKGKLITATNGGSAVNSATVVTAAEPNLDPPEYDEPEEVEPTQETIEIPFDCDIVLDAEGWNYEDESYDWAAGEGRNGDWYSEDGVFMNDKIGMVECIDDMLMTRLPDISGRYHISGIAILVFNIMGINRYSDFEGLDEDGDPSFNETLDTDYASADFNFTESTIENFEYELID